MCTLLQKFQQQYQDAVMYLRNSIIENDNDIDGHLLAQVVYALSSSNYAQWAFDRLQTKLVLDILDGKAKFNYNS